MTLAPGTRLGPYEILAPLGAGGMGEVFRARDTRLGRDVAIKALPAEFASDPERLARFEREARLLASLSHPNIAGIYGLEVVDGARYLALEFVDGDTLAARIARGPLGIDECVEVCTQIAAAVEAAHDAGIIHRDLKPGNVMLRSDGVVKVLDFGLAKGTDAHASSSSAMTISASPTMTYAPTNAGVILGTAAYMSPEQARGRAVDRRTDVWSFGCVLYECLTGRQVFSGETISDMVARILEREPEWDALPATTPPRLRELLRRCLTKDLKQRLQSIGEARIALEQPMVVDIPAATVPAARRGGVPVWGAAIALIAVAAVAAWGAAHLAATRNSDTVSQFDFAIDDLAANWPTAPSLSPDGRRFAYVAGEHIYVRDLADLTPHAVSDNQTAAQLSAISLSTPIAWSPDSRWIAFADRKKLWKAGAGGGERIALCDIPASGQILGAAWSRKGDIVFTVWRDAMYRVSEAGGAPALYVPFDSTRMVDFHFVHWLPNGELMYAAHWRDDENTYLRQAPAGAQRPAVFTFDGSRSTPMTGMDVDSDHQAAIDGEGHLLFVRHDPNPGIWATGCDLRAHHASGEPIPLARTAATLSISDQGSLLYTQASEGDDTYEMVWSDRRGVDGARVGTPRVGIEHVTLSPDGTRVAFAASPDGSSKSRSVFVQDARGAGETRLTFNAVLDNEPAWAPGGKSIAYLTWEATTKSAAYIVPADASGTAKPVVMRGKPSTEIHDVQFAPDGAHVVLESDVRGRGRIAVAPIAADGSWGPFTALIPDQPGTDFVEPRISPDGALIAYVMQDAQGPQVFVSRFPSGAGRWQVSTKGGRLPRWVRNSGELVYLESTGPDARALVSVAMHSGASMPVGASTTLFALGDRSAAVEHQGYDVAPDGSRFLLVRHSGAPSRASHLVLVQNYPELIRQLQKDRR